MRAMLLIALGAGLLLTAPVRKAGGHCQIPCGIYDDPLRINAMIEDVATIDKATRLIEELADKKDRGPGDENQIVRWVNAKEEHADKIQHTVLQYFLAQRIKPAGEKDPAAHRAYIAQLKALHAVVLASMKAKQEVSRDRVESLREAVFGFARLYLPEEDFRNLVRDEKRG